MAIIDFFDRGWRINPQGIAYIQGSNQWTFDEAGKLSCRIANALLAEGFSSGAKGAVWSSNDTASWVCTLGLWRANMTWLPVNARGSLDGNVQCLQNFDCDILFFQKQFSTEIESLRPQLPNVRLWICIDDSLEGSCSLKKWSKLHSDTPPDVRVDMDDVVMLSPTGGTTGAPKGVMNTHRSTQTFAAHFMMTCSYAVEEHPVNLAAAPMTHTAGLLSLPCTARGGTVVVLERPDAGPMLSAIKEHGVTEFFLPPTVIYRLLEIPGIEQYDFSSLRYFMYGAAPMSIDKLKKAIEVFGPVMTGGYGQTEAPASISFLSPKEHFEHQRIASDQRISSVGRPNPLVRVEIMDDNQRILPVGESGEICVRGDLVMKGYYKAQEKTLETIIDGWLHTGDIGHIDTHGYLHITDRKKDMIITGGFNVYPSDVEQVLWGHEAVQDCAVIGVPDEEWGEAVKAVIELNPGAHVNADELIALCKEKLGSVKAPKSIDFIDILPRSPVGKVLKKNLREHYWHDSVRKI